MRELSWEWYFGGILGACCGAFGGWFGVIGVCIGMLLFYTISKVEVKKYEELEQ